MCHNFLKVVKVVLPGGSGSVGTALARWLLARGHDVVVLSRRPVLGDARSILWDGETLGDWRATFEDADAVINLAGRTVNCRYNAANLKEMMDSRARSTLVVGEAIATCERPPKVWLQASTATIYAHRFDAANDEATGILGGEEPDSPPTWRASIEIAKAWEAAALERQTDGTRLVLLRSALTLSPDRGSVFDVLCSLASRGLGGQLGSGRQFVSWVHEDDFCRAVEFLIHEPSLAGPVNISAPNPLPQTEFARHLRKALGVPIGLPASEWMVEIGTRLKRTESELVLKSRRVVPGRLLAHWFEFDFPDWDRAAADLVRRWRLAGRGLRLG